MTYDKYYVNSSEFLSALNDLEDFVFNNEDSFLQKFSNFKIINTTGLVKFSITSQVVNYTFILNTGQHISNSIELPELFSWIAEVDSQNNIENLKKFNLETEDLTAFLQKVQTGELTCRLAAQILDEKINKNKE